MIFKKLLTRITGSAMVATLLISTTPVAATESVINEDGRRTEMTQVQNLLQSYQGGYIESELDNNRLRLQRQAIQPLRVYTVWSWQNRWSLNREVPLL